MRRILCIWLPNWPIQRLLAEQPERKGRHATPTPGTPTRIASLDEPLVLYTSFASGGQRVTACSEAAAVLGVRIGMPLAEATALAHHEADSGSTSKLLVQKHHPDADRAALEQLAQWCEQFSPVVGVEDAPAPESLLLNVTGLAPLFGGEAALVSRVQRVFQQRGYHPRVAIAETVGAAWALAHRSRHAPRDELPHAEREGYDGLPVEALRLPDETVDLLHQLGITRVGELLRLPRASLLSRFGPRLLQRLDQALGHVPEVISAVRPPGEFAAAWSLESPTAHRQTIEQVAQRLLECVAEELAAADQGALRLECRLDCSAGRSVQIRVDLFRPTAEPSHLTELLSMQLEHQRVPGAVHRVAVAAPQRAPLVWRQRELFDDQRREDPRELATLADRLSGRLGPRQVVRPRLVAAAQPERAYREVSAVSRQAAGQAGCQLHVRPLRLFSPPLPLQVVLLASGPPAMVRWDGEPHPIARHWGPERIETSWWRGRAVRRDYYRVETQSGSRFWVFRRLRDGRWFLHGEFA